MQHLRSRLQQVHVHHADVQRYRQPGRIACIVDSALSFSDNEDARRNHAIARALERQHYSIIVMSVPGIASEVTDSSYMPHQRIDGVCYLHISHQDGDESDSKAVLLSTVEHLKMTLRVFKPSLVLIAAETQYALAAAIAARELGLPYYYDIRQCTGKNLDENECSIMGFAAHSFTHSFSLHALLENDIAKNSAESNTAKYGRFPITLLPDPEHAIVNVHHVVSAADIPYAPLLNILRNVLHNTNEAQTNLKNKLAVAAQQQLKRLRVAAVMDDFTYSSYAPECDLLQLTPEHALTELEGFQPELLFIESAWRGKDELWGNKVGSLSSEVKAILAWCKIRRIPTVFWNKEDPVHFETFITTANQFDYVFTTDIDCIARYKTVLQHERVYLLPFAAQPQSHNPVEIYQRKDAFCFAGAYYVRYPERIKDLENYIAELPKFRPVEIFDRNFGKSDVNYQFPPPYQPFIVGTLAFKEIDKAYKGYRYSINLNSIKQSQTMYARRVYELLASNTITASNYSRGIRLMFGDLVITTDNGKEMLKRLQRLADDDENSGKLRLAALRKTMLEHTYAHRLAYVASKALHIPIASPLPVIVVIAYAHNVADQQLLLASFARQRHRQCRLILVYEGEAPLIAMHAVRCIAANVAATLSLTSLLRQGEWLAPMLVQDYYGPNYLLDLALAPTYTNVKLVGKLAHYAVENGGVVLRDSEAAYRPACSLPARSSAILAELLPEQPLLDLLITLQQVPATQWQMTPNLALDPYNYCGDASQSDVKHIKQRVDDLALDTGISIDMLLHTAEQIKAHVHYGERGRGLNASQLAANFGEIHHAHINADLLLESWRIRSELVDGKHDYIYATKDLNVAELNMSQEMKSHFELSPGLNVMLVVYFLDADKQRLQNIILTPNVNHTTTIPEYTMYIRLGLRVYGSGEADIGGVKWQHKQLKSAVVLGQQQYLVVTNQYPSYEALYRNGFVHSRLRAYREHGIRADVFCLKESATLSYHEFQDIDVISGSAQALELLLNNSPYHSILVHFLDAAMWQVLQKFAGKRNIIVWVHGSDIQPWHRRTFLYADEIERAHAQRISETRSEFWRKLLSQPPENFRLIFVSRFFADEVMHDLGLQLPERLYRIIHNPIDTDLFSWQPKVAEQRYRILSIRPYHSLVYANDLTVKVIQALSREAFFEKLEFRLIGDGPLFADTLAPLRGYRNVIIEQRFLPQAEIAQLHHDYGIFLCPSRTDTHGVSRDEAMSSGLVPITNAVAAIPEFVDDSCGMLAPSEDVEAMAAAIVRLVADPVLFLQLSSNAAQRVRSQSAKQLMTVQELALMRELLEP